MSSQVETDIDSIYLIFEHRFERHVIEEFYDANNQSIDRTVDHLFSLSQDELDSLQQNKFDHNAIIDSDLDFSKLELCDTADIKTVDIADKSKLRQAVADDNNQIASSITDDSSSSVIMDHLAVMFSGELTREEIQKVYEEIFSENSNCSHDALFALTEETCLSTIEAKKCEQEDELLQSDCPEDFTDLSPERSLKRDYHAFAAMFSGVIKEQRLKKLWKKIREEVLAGVGDSHISSDSINEDVMDLAVVSAMEFMDHAEVKARDANIHVDSELAASLAAEEGYFPEMFENVDVSGGSGDYCEEEDDNMRYSDMSSQDAALSFVFNLIGGDRTHIEACLKRLHYDVEACIQQLVIEATSSSAEVSSSSVSYKDSVKSSSSDVTKPATVATGTIRSVQSSGRKKDPRYRSFRQHVGYLNMSQHLIEHFLYKFRMHNPTIRVELGGASKKEIIIKKIDNLDTVFSANPAPQANNRDRFMTSHVAVDLHNLGVDVAIQVVDMSITFFEQFLKEFNRKKKQDNRLYVKYIVGKGLHSVGGIAKIRPAVQRYLDNERHELGCCWYEGVILVTI